MLNNIIKIKITSKKASNWFYFLIICASFLILSMVAFFLYNNFYQVLTQSKEVLLLRQKVVPESIDMEKFNKIMENIDKKNKIAMPEKIPDPFD